MSPSHDIAHGPVQQSLDIAMWLFRLALFAIALGWAAGNIRPVPPGSQAVVLTFGAVSSTLQAGLVVAWPRPIEQVVVLPSVERRMIFSLSGTPLLTGDGGIILLDGAVTWHITDTASYYIMQTHVPAALRRIYAAAMIGVAAGHDLDDFLAARPDRAADPHTQAARAAIRGEIVAAMNRTLAELGATGAGFGVEILRADITATLPADAKAAFDAVLEAAQQADQGVAAARTDAAHILQQADRDRDRILADAQAASAERVALAQATTATMTALEMRMSTATRPGLLWDIYRDRIAAVLGQAGTITTVDAKSVGRLILPGAGR